MSKQTDKSFFMFSPSPKYAGFYQELLRGIDNYRQLGDRLIHSAEQAHAFRQFDAVSEIGKILSNLPIKQYQPIGHYYLAIALIRHGKGDLNKAKSMLELVADTAPPRYRSRAILSLAAVLARKKDFDSELYFFVEALKASRDITTSLIASRGIAVHKSRAGDHKHAHKDLERMLPLIKYAPPHIYFDYLNSLALELAEVGRKYEARNIIKPVLESPFIIAYPEWQETADDLREANRSFVAINTSPLKLRNVLTMPALEREGVEFPTWAGQPAPVVNYQQWKKCMAKKKKNGDKPVEQMDVRDMLMEIMNVYTNDSTTDATRREIYIAVMKVISNPGKPDTPESPDEEPGA